MAKAEAAATNHLNGLNSIVDLSAEQKDKIFKHFSDDVMKMPDLEELPDQDEPGAVTVVVDSVEDPHSFLKSIFTPEQFQTYERHKERERKAQQERMELLDMPSLPLESIK